MVSISFFKFMIFFNIFFPPQNDYRNLFSYVIDPVVCFDFVSCML